MDKICKNCRWWHTIAAIAGKPLQSPKYLDARSDEQVDAGTCRRHAPLGMFPFCREDDWCGEWERKNVVEPVPTPIDKNFDR